MNNEKRAVRGKHDDLSQGIVSVFYDVYNELGYGFLECVYREAMRLALGQAGFAVAVEAPIPVEFRGQGIGVFRANLIVNNLVLIELKTCDTLVREHESQTLHYLRATRIEAALVMNFGPTPRFKRLVLDNDSKGPRLGSVESVSIGVKPLDDAPDTPEVSS